jgi:hypothetical protein
MRYLLDTNTCIAAMRHHAPVLQRLAAVAPADCAISSITKIFAAKAPGFIRGEEPRLLCVGCRSVIVGIKPSMLPA